MLKYTGIKTKDLAILTENRFTDSKAFYDEHKEEIKQNILLPMQDIMTDLTPFMLDINQTFFLVPSKRISRVRRDTRFTKDKTLYRDNIWMIFEPINETPGECALVFEITPDNIIIGTGMYPPAPRLMQIYRENMLAKAKSIMKEFHKAAENGFLFEGAEYKRPKEVFEDALQTRLFNTKELFVTKKINDISILEKPEQLIVMLKKEYTGLVPLYKFFSKCCEDYRQAELNLTKSN